MPRMPQRETSPSRLVIVGEVVAAAVIKISAPIAKRGAAVLRWRRQGNLGLIEL
jgi:hypothetical protein